ncbi:MAG TPA: hypothetical protein VIN10_11675 [Bacteroidales bacterium]
MENNLARKLSIVVSSSDGYDDCWDPFFTLLKNYFPGIEGIEVLLSTQTKDYSSPGFNLKVVKHGKKAAWSQRLRQTLEQTSHKIVLFLDEDSFLRSEVNMSLLTKLVDLMDKNNEIGHIRFAKGNWEASPTEWEFLQELKPFSRQRFMMLIGLWNKEVLLKHLVDHETTWSIEKWANIRSNILKDRFFCVSRSVIESDGSPYNAAENGGIYKGKWIEDYVVPLFSKNNIEIDFSKRGFTDQKARLASRLMIRLEPFLHPVLTCKSIQSIISLKFSRN